MVGMGSMLMFVWMVMQSLRKWVEWWMGDLIVVSPMRESWRWRERDYYAPDLGVILHSRVIMMVSTLHPRLMGLVSLVMGSVWAYVWTLGVR